MLRCLRSSSLWRQLHFEPSWLPGVKGFVGLDRRGERLTLCENLCGIDHAAQDDIHQHGDVLTVITIPHLEGEVFIHG
jgi:hypothetical protein